MNTLILAAALLVVLVVGLSATGFFLRYDNRVPVYGIDWSTGRARFARCKVDGNGAALWRVKGFERGRVTLESKYGLSGARGPVYVADVTPGQFRVLWLKSATEQVRMPGDRLDRLLAAGFNKEIADSSKTDLTAVIGKAIMAFAIVGGLLTIMVGWVIVKLNG